MMEGRLQNELPVLLLKQLCSVKQQPPSSSCDSYNNDPINHNHNNDFQCTLCAMFCSSDTAVSFCASHKFCSDCVEHAFKGGLSRCLFCSTENLDSTNTNIPHSTTCPPPPPLCSPSLPYLPPFLSSAASSSSSSLSLQFSPSFFNTIPSSSSSSSFSLPSTRHPEATTIVDAGVANENRADLLLDEPPPAEAAQPLQATSALTPSLPPAEETPVAMLPNERFFFNSQSPEFEEDGEDEVEEAGQSDLLQSDDDEEEVGGDDSSDCGDISLLIESEHPSLHADMQLDVERPPADFIDLEFCDVVDKQQVQEKTPRRAIFSRWEGLSKKAIIPTTRKAATPIQSGVDGWLSKKKKTPPTTSTTSTTPTTLATAVGASVVVEARKPKERKRKRKEKKAKSKGRKKRQRIGASSDLEDEGKENAPPSLGTSVLAIVDKLKQERRTKNERENERGNEDVFAFRDDEEEEEEAERIAWRKANKKLSQSSLEDFCFRLILPRHNEEETTKKEENQEREKENQQEKGKEREAEERNRRSRVLSQTDLGENKSQVPKTRIVLLGTGLSKDLQKELKAATSQLGGRIVSNFSDDVTHVVTLPDEQSGCAKRTIKYFNAIIGAKWILSYNWVVASLAATYWVNEGAYEMEGDNIAKGGPHKGRLREQHPQQPQQPQHEAPAPLFKGFCFCFHSKTFNAPYPSKAELQDLVKRGGGKVIARLPTKKRRGRGIRNEERNAEEEREEEEIPLQNVVVCDPASLTKEEANVIQKRCGEYPISVEWILSSISHYELLPLSSFML